MKWLIILTIALSLAWAVFHRQKEPIEATRSEVSDLGTSPSRLEPTSSATTTGQKKWVPSPAPIVDAQPRPHESIDESESEKESKEAKRDVVFLNEHRVDNIKDLVAKSRSWKSLPLIENKQGLAILVCGAGDVRFKKGIRNLGWHIVLDGHYRDGKNFGSVAILQRGELKSFHTSDEPGAFLADPNDVSHFVIKVSSGIYIQLFSMELGPNDDVNYVYAGNIFIQNENTKAYERMGIALLAPCRDEDAPWEGSGGLAPVDHLTFDKPID